MTIRVEQRVTVGAIEYRLLKISCGKPNCGKCPHGPYWYAYVSTQGGRTIKRYIGKNPPKDLAHLYAAEAKP